MSVARKVRAISVWLLQSLMAVAFVAIGTGKFFVAFWERAFARWGYPAGSHLVVGVVEALGGVLILVPRLSSYAALSLAVVMVGAIVTHWRAGEPWTRPLPHLSLLLLVAVVRWRDRWRPAASSPGAAGGS